MALSPLASMKSIPTPSHFQYGTQRQPAGPLSGAQTLTALYIQEVGYNLAEGWQHGP